MVKGSFKSGSVRKIHVAMPGGKTKEKFTRKTNAFAKCQITGEVLAGVPRTNITKVAKSSRRPCRPFGGTLSPKAMKRALIKKARSTGV
jgi:ribosomal protein L34E